MDISACLNFEHLFDALTPQNSEKPPLLPNLATLIIGIGTSAVRDDVGEEVVKGDITTEEHEDRVGDDTPFIRAMHRHAGDGLVLERRIHPHNSDAAWIRSIRRDPELVDWPEAAAFMR